MRKSTYMLFVAFGSHFGVIVHSFSIHFSMLFGRHFLHPFFNTFLGFLNPNWELVGLKSKARSLIRACFSLFVSELILETTSIDFGSMFDRFL